MAKSGYLYERGESATIRGHTESTMITVKRQRSVEEIAISRMRLLSHWLEIWAEDMADEEVPNSEIRTSFGILQLRDLKKTLDKLETKLMEFEEYW